MAKMSCREAGRRGGEATRDRGRVDYAEIGRRGAASCMARHGARHLAEIGRRGGEATARKRPAWQDPGRRPAASARQGMPPENASSHD